MNTIYVENIQFGYEVDSESGLIEVFFIKTDGTKGWAKTTQTSSDDENQDGLAKILAQEMLNESRQ